MELFQFVSVQPVEVNKQPAEVATRVSVAEGNHQRVNFGVGYGTEEKARVDAEYHHLNFLGGARTAAVHARWSSLDRGIRLELTQPYFFAPHFSLGVSRAGLVHLHAGVPLGRHRRQGDGHAPCERRDRVVGVPVVRTPVEHDRDGRARRRDTPQQPDRRWASIRAPAQQNGTATIVGFDLQHSTADNVLNARRGYQASFHVEQAGRFLPGTFNYWLVSADARHYLPIGDRLVWANRAQMGNIDPTGGDQTLVPFSKKYFLGGATCIRGWGRYEVSPLSGSGLPVGGDSMFAFTSELRASLVGNLGGVLFLDGGNVEARPWGIRFYDLEYAIGPGLRYQTPIGPIRFDVGFQLKPIPGLSIERQSGDTALAHPLQRRSGVLMQTFAGDT